MAQIREIKKRIKSIQNTQKVTHAMELVAAAKMKKAQLSALSGRPYSLSLEGIIAEVKTKSAKLRHTLLAEKHSPNQIIILITSERGLAGGLNINLFREILSSDLKNSQASKVSIMYPHFQSTIKQTPKLIQLLPIEFQAISKDYPNVLTTLQSDNLIFEPSADGILESILPHHILTQIYQVLLEAKASEHSSRMIAMKNATDAAGDLVEDLTLTYNQARQETITKELLDIVTAQRAFE